jgi:ATP-dependent phosphoenolpyruvate carboxykinase
MSATRIKLRDGGHRLRRNTMSQIDLGQYGISVEQVVGNLSAASLYQEALRTEKGTVIADSGALIAYSDAKTAPTV